MTHTSASSASPRATRARLKVTLHQLHEAIATRLLEGSHDRWEQPVSILAQSMWIDATTAGISPHVCLNRYCDCHVALWAEEPEQLTLSDEEPKRWGQDQPGRRCPICHVDHYPTRHELLEGSIARGVAART